MTVKTSYYLICENLVVDDIGRVTIINLFDSIYTQTVPSIQPNINLVCELVYDDIEKKDEKIDTYTLKVIDPSNNEILAKELDVKVRANPRKRFKFVMGVQMSGMPLTEFGNYTFKLLHGSSKFAERKVEVLEGTREDAVRNNVLHSN